MMRYGAEEMEGKAYSAVTIQRMAHYLRGDFTRLAIAAVMVILSSLLTLAGPFLIKFAIDDGIAGARPEVLAIAAGAYPVTLFAIWLFTYVQVRIVSQIGQRLLGRLRLDLFIHLQRLSPEFFAKRQIGNLMSRVVNDIDVLSDAISVGVLQIFGDGLVLITICVAMLLLDPGLAVLVFLTFPMTYLAARIYGVRAQRILRKSREAEADVNAELQESVVGVRIAQSFAREDRNIAKFHEINNRNFDAMMRANVVSYVLTPTVEIFRGIAIGIIVVYGGWRAIEGDLTVGVIVAFLTYVNRFFEPIRELSRWFHLLQASMVAGDRVFELLDEPVTVADRPGAVEAARIKGKVEFDGGKLRVHSGSTRPERGQLRHRAWADGGAGWTNRCRQDDDRELADSLLRRQRWPRIGRRSRRSGLRASLATKAYGSGPPGPFPVLRNSKGQHCLRPADGYDGRSRGGGTGGWGGRVHS